MKRRLGCLVLAALNLFLCACGEGVVVPPPETILTTAEIAPTAEEVVETTAVPAEFTETDLQPHSPLYLPGVSVEDVILYFNEVVLAAEFNTGTGDPGLVQKWTEPIIYRIEGMATPEDLAVLEDFAEQLNAIEGFPGLYPADGDGYENLSIYFCDQKELMDRLGDELDGVDGAVTFWYENDVIYEATICCRVDIPQLTRNSVIQEEIYNGLGPVQDTELRADSLIFTGYSEPQAMTAVDVLILKLLYHPDIQCGMTREECEAVIRSLYY